MNPLRLTASNYRTFEHLDVDLPSGCVAVVGPNGAGKSSILNVVDVALFAARGELAPLLTVGEEDLELVLEFEHAGELYRVRRTFSARGRGKTTLDFEHQLIVGNDHGPDLWDPLTRETAEQTQQLIEDTIGLTRTTFRASSFLRQGDGAAFTEAKPADRKRILAEILGLDLWQRLQDRARADLRTSEDELIRARTLIASNEELAATRPAVTAALQQESGAAIAAQAEHDTAVEDLEQAQRQLADARVQAERVRACQAEHQAAVEACERATVEFAAATRAADELADKTVELGELAADADRVPMLERQLADARTQADTATAARAERDRLEQEAGQREIARDRLVAQVSQLHDEAQAARGKADHLDAHIADAATCDRCGQTLGAEAAARAAASYRADADALDARAQLIDQGNEQELAEISALHARAAAIVIPDAPDPAPVEAELRVARSAAERRATVAEQVRQLSERATRAPQLEETLRAATATRDEKLQTLDALDEPADEQALAARVDTLSRTVKQLAETLSGHRATCARLEGELDRIAAAEARVAEHRELIADTQSGVDLLKLADRAFGRDGIPALIVENAAVPQLELEANRVLAELGTPFRVELRTQKALKTSDELRDTLDIVVVDGHHERPYETFSGGERTRLNLALRIALARLLAHRRGAESRLLAIDEPEYLDEAGTARLGDVLRGLAGDFDRILLVSHHPTLAAAFDSTISVVKDGDRSRVDAGVEAVTV